MKRKTNILILVIIFIFLIPIMVSADLGSKPSIHINIKNLGTDNYVIDLFTYADDARYYYPDVNYSNRDWESYEKDINELTVYFDKIAKDRHITIDQAKQLYNLDYDGWISKNTRNSVLWGYCNGNSNHAHDFNYMGTPTRYKIVIINYDTGETKISDEIIREDHNSYVTIDYKTMNYKTGAYFSKLLSDTIICLVLTVLIELAIAFVFKTHHYKTIIITNICTNILLQINLFIFSRIYNYLLVLLISEVLVFIIELITYFIEFKEFNRLKISIYTIVANAVTIILTFLLRFI